MKSIPPSFIRSLTRTFAHSLDHSLTHSFIHSLLLSLTHSLTPPKRRLLACCSRSTAGKASVGVCLSRVCRFDCRVRGPPADQWWLGQWWWWCGDGWRRHNSRGVRGSGPTTGPIVDGPSQPRRILCRWTRPGPGGGSGSSGPSPLPTPSQHCDGRGRRCQ